MSEAKAEKKAKKAKKAEGEAGPRGRKSKFSGKHIYKLTDGGKNPRKEGSIGHKSFALIRNGMTYEQYITAGGRRQDLDFDLGKKYVELKNDKA